ncbi:MAG: 30S ribosome-binding factor RbfA [Holosporales bacterium]|nr:30S ribosome-binding factor RbfA [Holosporales bacterium]
MHAGSLKFKKTSFLAGSLADRTQKPQRQERVAREVQRILVRAMRETALPNMTITAVRMTPCLRQAKVYVLPFCGRGAATLLRNLQSRKPSLRREVGRKLALRYVPELHFFIDNTIAHSERIESLLRSLPPAQTSAYPSEES